MSFRPHSSDERWNIREHRSSNLWPSNLLFLSCLLLTRCNEFTGHFIRYTIKFSYYIGPDTYAFKTNIGINNMTPMRSGEIKGPRDKTTCLSHTIFSQRWRFQISSHSLDAHMGTEEHLRFTLPCPILSKAPLYFQLRNQTPSYFPIWGPRKHRTTCRWGKCGTSYFHS